ncbi:unnamed protein product [Malus baccata var. baccata]
METASKMVEKAAAFASGKSSTEAKEKVEALNKDIEASQGSSNVNSEEGQGSGIGIQNECRICQEEDYLHKLEAPCRCNGTLKFAHRDCVQKWINERLSMTSCFLIYFCPFFFYTNIYRFRVYIWKMNFSVSLVPLNTQPYEAGYTMVIPPTQPSPQTENVTIPIRQVQFPEAIKHAAGLQAAQRTAQTEAAAEFLRHQHAMQAHGGGAFNANALCRIAAVICLTFLVMKDMYYFYESGQDSHLLTIFWVLLGLLIPSYLIAWCASAYCCAPNQSEGDLAVVEVAVPEVPVAAALQALGSSLLGLPVVVARAHSLVPVKPRGYTQALLAAFLTEEHAGLVVLRLAAPPRAL